MTLDELKLESERARFKKALQECRPNDVVGIPDLPPHVIDEVLHELKRERAQGHTDQVNHPSHYTTGGIECFDAMRAMLTDEEMIGYLRGNSFKYRWRFRHKGGIQDLKKAEWYEQKLLEILPPST